MAPKVFYLKKNPSCFSTLLGRGVYTQRDCLLFNTRTIVEYFYNGAAGGDTGSDIQK